MNYHMACSIAPEHPASPRAIADWCAKCLGPQGVRWQMRSTYGAKAVHLVIVEFMYEKDQVMFSLVWTPRTRMHHAAGTKGPAPSTMIPTCIWGEKVDE